MVSNYPTGGTTLHVTHYVELVKQGHSPIAFRHRFETRTVTSTGKPKGVKSVYSTGTQTSCVRGIKPLYVKKFQVSVLICFKVIYFWANRPSRPVKAMDPSI